MPGMYYATGTTIETTAQDIFTIQPNTSYPVTIHAFELSQITEEGDAAEDMAAVQVFRRTGTPTAATGTATSAHPADQRGAADSATVLTNLTVSSSGGTQEFLAYVGWNVRSPYLWMPPPEGRITVTDNDLFVVRLSVAPADGSMTMYYWMLFEEH